MLEKSKSDGNRGLTDERYKEAKSRIINAASDQKENAIVRHTAVRSLGQIGDRSDVPLLQRLAVSDAASYKAMDGSIRFPVREEAIRGLQKMAK
jgi:HEAT repeat protein